jgi:hypothetical protein
MPAGPGCINQQRDEPLHPAIDGDVGHGLFIHCVA